MFCFLSGKFYEFCRSCLFLCSTVSSVNWHLDLVFQTSSSTSFAQVCCCSQPWIQVPGHGWKSQKVKWGKHVLFPIRIIAFYCLMLKPWKTVLDFGYIDCQAWWYLVITPGTVLRITPGGMQEMWCPGLNFSYLHTKHASIFCTISPAFLFQYFLLILVGNF